LKSLAFIDLAAQQVRIKSELDAAIASVLAHGQYIMGPEVAELEAALEHFCGATYAITCANGTDALQLAVMALGAGAGDAVFVPAFTFAATAEILPPLGAIPVLVDVCPRTFAMDPGSLQRALDHARSLGLHPRGVIPVDLFGLPADYDPLQKLADQHNLWVLADAAQAFGARYGERRAGTLGDMTTTSFFPAKPLGCYGDGGAVFTDDPDLAELLRSLRVHGKGTHKYDNARVGINSRLDTLQAAILLPKLAIYADEIKRREAVAQRYHSGLTDVLDTPETPTNRRSVWAQYTVRLPARIDRDVLRDALSRVGIPTAVYYPRPLHLQPAYATCPTDPAGLTISEQLAGQVLSLPMHPYLATDTQDRIIERVRGLLERRPV
jgi:dTDP-4-amino-4,6-dideoxygalactose transaminase